MKRIVIGAALAAGLIVGGAAQAPAQPSQKQTKLLWGDTHLHSSYSPDAYALLTHTADPDRAYRFAKGLPVIADLSRSRVQIDRPLDFLVVTDHAEFMGVIPEIDRGNAAMLKTELGAQYKQWMNEGKGDQVLADIVRRANLSRGTLGPLNTDEVRRSVWKQIVETADRHNQPGVFTAFIGWEWSSTPDGRNLHRIVFTPDGADKAINYLPFSLLDSQKPRDLWKWLADTSKAHGTDFISIGHNMNLSTGAMFPLVDEYGRPVDAEYARLRRQWEPVEEITQYKGDSETHPKLSPNDAFADFETYEKLLAAGASPTDTKLGKVDKGSYARSGLLRGLELEAKIGVNPYQFGMIGASDSHTGFSAVEEDNFLGKYAVDSIPENKRKTTVPGAIGWDAAAQGLAGVWATENTRQAIFEAFKRREVYATTGPRISLRVFGGYGYKSEDAKAADLVQRGYAGGVPMGGELTNAPASKAPQLLIHAAKDPAGANLDRVQVVKGFLGKDGKAQEKIYEVVWAGERKPDASGKVPSIGSTVDLKRGTYENSIGTAQLSALWTDPDFDPAQRAFYYVRAIQIPTPRHSTLDAIALKIDPPKEYAAEIQDRAYSSAIWYSPSKP